MPSLTSPKALEDMLCRYAVELLDIPVSPSLLPTAFLEMLPATDYVPTPVAWEPAYALAKEFVGRDTVTESDYAEFSQLVRATLTSLNRKLHPVAIIDPFHKILRDKWRDANPEWEVSEYRYRLHLIRPELRHPDFGDTIKGVRVEKPKAVSKDVIGDLINSFYADNPEAKRADKLIQDIVEGKSLDYKSDLAITSVK